MAASLIAPMVSSLIQIVASSFINVISEKIAMTARKGQDGGFIPLLTLALMIEVLEKGATKAGKYIITWIIWIKKFSVSLHLLKQYQDY